MFNIPAILAPLGGGFVYPYEISNSCMFDPSSGNVMQKNHTTGATSQLIGTMSVWLKRASLGQHVFWSGRADVAGRYSFIGFAADNQLQVYMDPSAPTANMHTNAFFRDCAGWYHFVVAFDTPQATASNRIKIYVNGDQITSFSATDYPDQNDTIRAGDSDENVYWGAESQGPALYFDGHMSQACWIDGTAYTADDFGELINGIWVPKDITGLSYGNQGHLLDFADSADLGNDVAGGGHDMTSLTGFGTDHQVLDSPTNNHCVLDINNTRSNITAMSEGATKVYDSGAACHQAAGTFLMKTGKWYWEVALSSVVDAGDHCWAGILAAGELSGDIIISDLNAGDNAYQWGIRMNGTVPRYEKSHNTVDADLTLGTPVNTEVMQIAFDADANKLWFGVDNVWNGDPGAGTGADYDSSDGLNSSLYDYVPFTAVQVFTTISNFGQRAFAFTPPTGFRALAFQNLSAPATLEPRDGADVVLYEGTGAELAISSLDFSPDFVWIKNRDAADPHHIYDLVRGATKRIETNAITIEQTAAQTLKSFDTTGFTLGTDVEVNTSGENYFALSLKKGAKFGFDIVAETGNGTTQAINHALGAVPELIVAKALTYADHWVVYHHHALNKTDPETDRGVLSLAAATWADDITPWNDVAPTSSQFTVGTALSVNKDTEDYIFYLWRSIAGFSKVFSFVGNGNAAGPYVYCGFKPRWILFKNAGLTSSWLVVDTARSLINPIDIRVSPDLPGADTATGDVDVYSNGFKVRTTGTWENQNDALIVGIAFADQPGNYSNAR